MSDEETTIILSVDELKQRLHLAGIDYSGYTDNDLETLITLTIEDIESITGLPIANPRLVTEYKDKFHNNVYETDFYPFQCCLVTIDGDEVEPHRIDYERGILYFKPKIIGELEVKYKIQYTDVTVLSGLITNMIILDIESDTVHGTWNSVKEGDVSVTYGSGSGGLTEKVNDTLNNLSGYFQPRVKML